LLPVRACLQPLYGFSNKDPAKYIKAAGHSDLYCLQDKELSIDQVCAHERVCMYMCACVRMCVRVHVRVRVCMHAMCAPCVCAVFV